MKNEIRAKKLEQKSKTEKGQIRFIGNLHPAMRATDNEKQKIKEVNALLREALEYKPDTNEIFDKCYSRGHDLVDSEKRPEKPQDHHSKEFTLQVQAATSRTPSSGASSAKPNQDLKGVINFQDYSETGYSLMPKEEIQRMEAASRPGATKQTDEVVLLSFANDAQAPASLNNPSDRNHDPDEHGAAEHGGLQSMTRQAESDEEADEELQAILKLVNENQKMSHFSAIRRREEGMQGHRPSIGEVLSGQHEVMMKSEFSKIIQSKQGFAGLDPPREDGHQQRKRLEQTNCESINKMRQFFKTQNDFMTINRKLRSKSHLRPRPSINKVLQQDNITRDSSEDTTLPVLKVQKDPISEFLSKSKNNDSYSYERGPHRTNMNVRTTMSSRNEQSSKFDFAYSSASKEHKDLLNHMQTKVASLINKRTVNLSEFRSTLQPYSEQVDHTHADDQEMIAQRLSDMIDVSREITAARDWQRKKQIFKEDGMKKGTTIQQTRTLRGPSLSPLSSHQRAQQESPQFDGCDGRPTPSFQAKASSFKSKRDHDYNLKSKVRHKILSERRPTNPTSPVKYFADFAVKRDLPSFNNEMLWRIHTSKIHENNIKGIGSILKEPTMGRSNVNLHLKNQSPQACRKEKGHPSGKADAAPSMKMLMQFSSGRQLDFGTDRHQHEMVAEQVQLANKMRVDLQLLDQGKPKETGPASSLDESDFQEPARSDRERELRSIEEAIRIASTNGAADQQLTSSLDTNPTPAHQSTSRDYASTPSHLAGFADELHHAINMIDEIKENCKQDKGTDPIQTLGTTTSQQQVQSTNNNSNGTINAARTQEHSQSVRDGGIVLKVEAGDEGSAKASKLEIIALENLKIAEKISKQMDFNISFVKIRRNETLDEQSPRTLKSDWINDQGRPMAVRGGGGSLPRGPPEALKTRSIPNESTSQKNSSILQKYQSRLSQSDSNKIAGDTSRGQSKQLMVTSQDDIAQGKGGQASSQFYFSSSRNCGMVKLNQTSAAVFSDHQSNHDFWRNQSPFSMTLNNTPSGDQVFNPQRRSSSINSEERLQHHSSTSKGASMQRINEHFLDIMKRRIGPAGALYQRAFHNKQMYLSNPHGSSEQRELYNQLKLMQSSKAKQLQQRSPRRVKALQMPCKEPIPCRYKLRKGLQVIDSQLKGDVAHASAVEERNCQESGAGPRAAVGEYREEMRSNDEGEAEVQKDHSHRGDAPELFSSRHESTHQIMAKIQEADEKDLNTLLGQFSWSDNPENERKLLELMQEQPLHEILIRGMSQEDQYTNIKKSMEKKKLRRREAPTMVNTQSRPGSTDSCSETAEQEGDDNRQSKSSSPAGEQDEQSANPPDAAAAPSKANRRRATVSGRPIFQLLQEDPLVAIDIEGLPPSLQYRLKHEPNEHIGGDEEKKAEYQRRVAKMLARCQKRIQRANARAEAADAGNSGARRGRRVQIDAP